MKAKYKKIFFGVFVLLMISVSSMYGRTLTVGVAGTGANYDELSNAVNNAQSGDTLLLLSDITIKGEVSFSKSVVVKSARGCYSILKGDLIGGLFNAFINVTINSNAVVEFVDVCLNVNNKTSSGLISEYYFYVNVNSGATLKLSGQSSVRNSTGGAVMQVNGTVIGGLVTKNTTSSTNVGLVYVNSGGLLVDMVIASNTLANSNVAAVNLNGGSMVNCTILNNNSSSGNSPNRYAVSSTNNNCRVTNCIIYGNGAAVLGSATVRNSCVQGIASSNGNINVDPQLNSDYSLRSGSPCIDAGNNSAISAVTDVDYFGNVRIFGEKVDMGAAEYVRDYCEKTDTRFSCGEPFVWIDGKTYTESNNTATDTISGGTDCDTIVYLDLTVYPSIDKSSMRDEDVNYIECSGEEVTFSFQPNVGGRTSYRWLSAIGQELGISSTLTVTVGDYDMEYLFIASTPSGECPDTTIFRSLVNYDFSVQNPVNLSVDSASNDGCALKALDLTYYRPNLSYCSNLGKDTTFYYKLNDGPWVNFSSAPVLNNVVTGDKILWRVVVRTKDDNILEDRTTEPVVVNLTDNEAPVLSCDDISSGKRIIRVADSINGVVTCVVSLQDVILAANDNCSVNLQALVSLDGTSYSEFLGYSGSLNVFELPSFTAYFKVQDEGGLQSAPCAVTYEVERASEVNGKRYAIVRDSLVCSLPVVWHGHTFTYDGETAEVGAALLSVRMDSSYFKTETITHVGPYTWRNGVTYTESVNVDGFHQSNVGACDSVFSLRLTIKTPGALVIDDPVTPIDSVANDGCALLSLDLLSLAPGFVYDSGNGVDTTVYYKVNGGSWIDLRTAPSISHVVNGTSIYWKVSVSTTDARTISDETTVPQLIRVLDSQAPSLVCELVSSGKRLLSVADSVSGRVSNRILPSDVQAAGSDDCSSVLTVLLSRDGVSFSDFSAQDIPLNVFTQPSLTLYWKVSDASGNISDACPVEYSVERATEVSGKRYAIVRDTLVCLGDFPYTWHGHLFNSDGETAEVGAALLTVHADSSFFKRETIVSSVPYTWRNGVTYSESTDVDRFVQSNGLGCDSVFSLRLIIKNNRSLVVNEAVSPIERVANDSCDLDVLDLTDLVPSFSHNSASVIDTVIYYKVAGGDWVDLARQSLLYHVKDGAELYWKVSVNTADTALSDETVNPQVIRVRNAYEPVLACDRISLGKRTIAVHDSINGGLTFTVSPSEVKDAASSPCSSNFEVLYSNDGVNFSPYNGLTFNLNVFDNVDRTLYWRVKDESGNLSASCPAAYVVERATEVDGKMYAIVRDSLVCANSFPVVWHGHVFNTSGEKAEIGAALLSVKVDSSYYRYDTLVVCDVNSYTWQGTKYNSGTYDLSYVVDNGPDACDSVVYMHLAIYKKDRKTVADTVYMTDCYGEPLRLGYSPRGLHTDYTWYEQGVLKTDPEWVGATQRTTYFSGHDNYQYMLITSIPGGYCPDTTVYITNSTHFIESDDAKSMVLFAGENCKAKIRLRDYMPGFTDKCSFDFVDTLCAYRINHGVEQYAGANDYYEFADGDSISWRVGIYATDGSVATVSGEDFYQLVRVVDVTKPRVDSLGISFGNRIHSVADSVVGDVLFDVPLSDVTGHVSDNCDDVSDLTIQYSLDGVRFTDFNGVSLTMNVYESPSVMVYYTVTDRSNNTLLDSVLYSVERKSFVGEDSFAIVRDTMVCPSMIPFTWHGATFRLPGVPSVVGAAYLTVNVDASFERYDTVFVCDSYVWRDGVEYTNSTTEPTFVVNNGEGECDSLIHLNLTVLNPSSGSDSIVVCVKELPYDWNGYQITGDSILRLRNVLGCDSLVDVKVVVLPIATQTIYDTACVSYRLNDSVYTRSGVYEQVLTSAVTGCDSVLTLHLVVNQESSISITDTACGSYTLNDSVYTESGVYQQHLVSSTGCDSVITLNLTILHPSYGVDTLLVCEGSLPVRWNGRMVYGDTTLLFRNAVGCDSFVSLRVIENPIVVVQVYDTACGVYAIGDSEFNKSGEYTLRFSSSSSCDSIIKLHLTILESVTNTIYETACGSYELNGVSYDSSGVYEQHLTAANGCDSLLILFLSVQPAGDTTITEIAKGSYTLNDSVYTKSGHYEQHIRTENGCDSIVRLDLTIVEGIVTEWSESVCESGMWWESTLLKESGTYSKTFKTKDGLDSTSILHLTIIPTKYTTLIDTAYSYYVLNDSVYTRSGIYVQTLTSSVGCDSIVTLTLKILNVVNGVVQDTSCSSYTLNDSVYTESGIYEQHFITPEGRDSTLTLELVIYPTYEVELRDTACGSYKLNGVVYTESGHYEQILEASTGCDSVVKLDLTILNAPKTIIYDTVCGSYVLNDSVYTESGVFEQSFVSRNGCDSVIQLNLTVLPVPVTEIFDTVCISYKLNDSVYTETGVYEQRFQAYDGCDSIVRINLVVLSSPTVITYDTACISYTVDGMVYTESTVLEKKVNSPTGCDSILTVHLTILPIVKDTIYRTACGSYTLNDSVYTESGVYTQILESSVGCDSILTLYLTLLEPTYGVDTVNICENASSVVWNGFDISSDTSLVIPNHLGCDSIVSIHLNRLPIVRSEFSDTSCAPYVWNDKEYYVSGDYEYKLTSSIGCDSIRTLHLTILPSYEIFLLDSAVSYFEWNGVVYDTSGIYTQHLVSSVGCDSVVTIGVTVLPPPEKAPEKVSSCISYEWQGRVLKESGVYYDILRTASGEDSIVSIDLTINQPKYNNDTIYYTVCKSDLPVEWNGYLLSNDTSRVILTTKEGCDSFLVFRLNILPVYDSLEYAESCDSFEWHGRVFYESGVYYDTLQSYYGCDSVSILSLNIRHSSITKIRRSLCESELPVVWNEYEFYGDTLIVFPSANGCDSIIDVKLDVYKQYNLVFDEVSCGDFSWQGKMLSQSGTYVDSFTTLYGCDSIVTLHLVVSHPSRITLVDTTLAGSIYEKNGFTVDASQIGNFEYEVNLKSQYGCDSIVHLSLYVDGRDIDISWTSVSGGSSVFFGEKNMGRKFCAGDEYFLNYRILGGVPDTFKLNFDSEGITQGFRNVVGRLGEGEVGAVTFTVPEGVAPGTYYVHAQLFGEGKCSRVETVPIRVGYDARYVTKMWNDVIVCDNSKNEFVSYQWRRDDRDIPGATGQYYFEQTGLNGHYSLHAVTNNNDTVYVCGKYFEPLNVPFSISTYPVYSNYGKVTVYVKGLSDEELRGAKMYVYTMEGVLKYWTDIVHKETEVWVTQGRYVCIVILADERSATCKFVSFPDELIKY